MHGHQLPVRMFSNPTNKPLRAIASGQNPQKILLSGFLSYQYQYRDSYAKEMWVDIYDENWVFLFQLYFHTYITAYCGEGSWTI
jgi:hypothetical protein